MSKPDNFMIVEYSDSDPESPLVIYLEIEKYRRGKHIGSLLSALLKKSKPISDIALIDKLWKFCQHHNILFYDCYSYEDMEETILS